MRFVSTMALGLMLAAGSVAMVGASPAMAAKKEQAPKQSFSDKFRAAAGPLQKDVQDKKFDDAKAKLAGAEEAASTPEDKYAFNMLRLQIGLGIQDVAMQRAGVEGMLASGAAPVAEAPKYEFYAGDYAMKAGDADAAIAHLQKAVAGGYPGSSPHVLMAEAYFKKAIATGSGNNFTADGKAAVQAGLPHLKQGIDIEKAAGAKVPAAWYERGFQLSYVAGLPQASDWAFWTVQADPSGKNWRNLLRVYQDSHTTLTKGENLDLLRLMRQTKAMASAREYSDYAEAAYGTGLPGEAKAVIDEGRAAGSVGASQLNEIYQLASGKIAADKASLPSGEASASKAATGKAAAGVADAYMSYGDYAKAVSLYKLALQKGSVDPNEINLRLGIALAKSGDAAGAKSAFEAVSAGARRDIAKYWLLWLSEQQPA